MTSTGPVNYSTFISNLEAKGLQTTWLADGETNFQQYGEALSDGLKQEILQSFDAEQDYILQQQVAELFRSSNVMDSGSFISACQSLGLNCSVTYESTSYIVDWKASQSGAVVDGAIAVYTISDGKGGEIKIADANGNGSLESEELFMNEILGDISKDISATGANSLDRAGAAVDAGPTQEEFNLKVEEYLNLNAGFTKDEATKLANLALGTENAVYTGTYEDVTQEQFNATVEKYMKAMNTDNSKYARAKAISQAREELPNAQNMNYTGNYTTEKEDSAISFTSEEDEAEETEVKSSISLVSRSDEDKKEEEAA